MKPQNFPAATKSLFDTVRLLVADGGMRKFSVRGVAACSGWTLGEINYHFGKKNEILKALLESEREDYRCLEAKLAETFNGISQVDGPMLALMVSSYLDYFGLNKRTSVIFWDELLIESGTDAAIREWVTPWITEREEFWKSFLSGRHPYEEPMARIISKYILEEQVYSITLASVPDYRVLRDLGIMRLCEGLLAKEGQQSLTIFRGLGAVEQRVDDANLQGAARKVGASAAELLRKQGVSAVTHRSVAKYLNMSKSAVAHHFRTHLDLLKAANSLLFAGYRDSLDVERVVEQIEATPRKHQGLVDPNLEAVDLVRAMHLLNLAATRNDEFVPLVEQRRRRRGQTSILWIGRMFDNPEYFDDCSAQVTSIIFGGDLLMRHARGEKYIGTSPQTLSDLSMISSREK